MTICRGIRGATTVTNDEQEEVLRATRELLALMIRLNGIEPADVASAIFTTTHDVRSVFPALAARQLGWLEVPLLCTHEISVPGSLPLCVRVLLHWNTQLGQSEIQHVYLRDAVSLRPDQSLLLSEVDFGDLNRWIDEQLVIWRARDV
ncbi:MAG: chorismate mutase [Caldilineaceae bacterium]|nr:chorismate mutase [Caldilineaceae bacterium]